MTVVIVQSLILISQWLHVMLGCCCVPGVDADEMLCSRAWRHRNHPGWRELRWFVDNLTPLRFWRSAGMTHCESCFAEEAVRRAEKLAAFLPAEFDDTLRSRVIQAVSRRAEGGN